MTTNTPREKQQDQVTEEADLNMTPMIDVVFLLIIFFLCIDFKILEAKLPAYLPKDSGSQQRDTEPIRQLRVQIACETVGTQKRRNPGSESDAYYLVGHKVTYTCGAKKVATLVELKDELEEIYQDPAQDVPDLKHPGQTKKMSVVVEPGVNTVYGDVAPCVDAISATGFRDIHFGGGLGSSHARSKGR